MKSPTNTNFVDDCDDIFGPPRSYAAGYCASKTRPSMISAKYRQKEERRKVLKISINKLKKIEDPEASLCRSVLINNTMRRLQKEAREEKQQKQFNYSRFNMSETSKKYLDCDFENDFDKLDQDTSTNKLTISKIVEESLTRTFDAATDSYDSCQIENERITGKKRSFTEIDDCDVQDVLSQFYMPPTPRMLTSLDDTDEEDVNVVDDDVISPKKSRLDDNKQFFSNLTDDSSNSYSCGHSSIFNDLQNNVFHSLIASLET